MDTKQKQALIKELELIEQRIDDMKLEDTQNYKELKNKISERERIKFRLWFPD